MAAAAPSIKFEPRRICEGLRWGSVIRAQGDLARRIADELSRGERKVPAALNAAAEFYLELAIAFSQVGDYGKTNAYCDEVEKFLDGLLKDEPSSLLLRAEMLFLRATNAREWKDTEVAKVTFSDALEHCKASSAIEPKSYARFEADIERNAGITFLPRSETNVERATKAREHFQKGIEVLNAANPRSEFLLPLRNYFALATFKLGLASGNEEKIEEALALFEAVNGEYLRAYSKEDLEADCEDYISHCSHYGDALRAMKQYDKALSYLEAAYCYRDANLKGQQRNRVADTATIIAEVYQQQGKTELACEWYHKALDAFRSMEKPDEKKMSHVDLKLKALGDIRVEDTPRVDETLPLKRVMDAAAAMGSDATANRSDSGATATVER